MATVLAVDDSPSMRMLVETTLKQHGHQVILAQDGAEALAAARQAELDLVLTDVNMPNMNGIQLVSELRKIERFRFTPILMLTTEGSNEKKQEGRKAGATGWITKPFDPEKLISTVDKVL
ncbi:MAG TPA: response regulator [Myxococcales bacterium LLY-WYZ-16_1]|nr:response regulator [Myxococcales bacterium LLY-WYZ-16_1]